MITYTTYHHSLLEQPKGTLVLHIQQDRAYLVEYCPTLMLETCKYLIILKKKFLHNGIKKKISFEFSLCKASCVFIVTVYYTVWYATVPTCTYWTFSLLYNLIIFLLITHYFNLIQFNWSFSIRHWCLYVVYMLIVYTV
jgi:hypothetical protein